MEDPAPDHQQMYALRHDESECDALGGDRVELYRGHVGWGQKSLPIGVSAKRSRAGANSGAQRFSQPIDFQSLFPKVYPGR